MYRSIIVALALSLFASVAVSGGDDGRGAGEKKMAATDTMSFLDFTVKRIDGSDVELSTYKGDVCLVVNVASK